MSERTLPLTIIYFGNVVPGATDRHRRDALERVVEDVVTVGKSSGSTGVRRLRRGITRRIGLRESVRSDNRRLLDAIASADADAVWMTKPHSISRRTLITARTKAPQLRLITYSGDDYSNPANMSRNFSESLPLFDLVVTTKSYNVPELKQVGARRVEFVDNAFEPTVHRPLRSIRGGARDLDVVFIGSHESERASSILALAQSGVTVHVFGHRNWRRATASHENIHLHEGELRDDEYAQGLSRAKIALGFLRKANRDLQTTRSVEVPACGAVLAAERTDEHTRLFRENREAVYFNGDAEMIRVVRRLLDDDAERERIAAAGLGRIQKGDLSNESMMRRVLTLIEKGKPT